MIEESEFYNHHLDENNNNRSNQIDCKITTSIDPEQLWKDISDSIDQKDIVKFQSILNRKENFEYGKLLINEVLLKCVQSSSSSSSSSDINMIDECSINFIEKFMSKLCNTPCYFACWDVITCKQVVAEYLRLRRRFTHNSLVFLLRCNDVNLVQSSFENEIVNCELICSNWDIMFITSYKEKFFTNNQTQLCEGFIARYILLCRLRCSLKQKRNFLTWFAGLIYMYTDDYFYRIQDVCSKYVLIILFECLILNGFLTNTEFKNLYEMFMSRNDMMKELYSNKNGKSVEKISADLSYYQSNLLAQYPFSLKNICRIKIKNSMIKYSRKYIEQLPLPSNLKRFLYFEHECQTVLRELSQHN